MQFFLFIFLSIALSTAAGASLSPQDMRASGSTLFSVNLNLSSLREEFRSQSSSFSESLHQNSRRLQLVYVVCANSVSYLLLRRNERDLYEVPIERTGENFIERLEGLGNFGREHVLLDMAERIPANIIVAHPSLDDASLRDRDTRREAGEAAEYVFIRSSNLDNLYRAFFDRSSFSDYEGINASGQLFARAGEETFLLDPSVLIAMECFMSLRGWMDRMGDIDLDTIASRFLSSSPSSTEEIAG